MHASDSYQRLRQHKTNHRIQNQAARRHPQEHMHAHQHSSPRAETQNGWHLGACTEGERLIPVAASGWQDGQSHGLDLNGCMQACLCRCHANMDASNQATAVVMWLIAELHMCDARAQPETQAGPQASHRTAARPLYLHIPIQRLLACPARPHGMRGPVPSKRKLETMWRVQCPPLRISVL